MKKVTKTLAALTLTAFLAFTSTVVSGDNTTTSTTIDDDADDDGDKGKWGLTGLAGLLGLPSLKKGITTPFKHQPLSSIQSNNETNFIYNDFIIPTLL